MPPPLVVSLLVLVSLPMVPWASRLTFDLVPETGSLDPRALAAFQAAADRWWKRFYNDVAIYLAAGMKPLVCGTLGPAASRAIADSYTGVRALRIADSNSAAANHRPADLPTGVPTYLDNNADNIDRLIQRTYANARALGVPVNSPYPIGAVSDLHSGYVWDLNPADSGTPVTYDVVGVTTHESGDALGFLNGVDEPDAYSVPKNGLLRYASTACVIETLNLFRYCGPGTSAGVMDFSADSRSRFLSVDIGITGIAQFANGKKFSDAGQAGHGKDDSGMEIVNPGAPAGRWLRVGPGDMAALDAIGWNTLEKAPGPDRLALCLIGLLAMVPSLLRRRGEIGGKRAGRSRRFHTGPYRIN